MFKFNKISLNCKNIYCNYLHLNLFILKCTNDILHTFKASVHLFQKYNFNPFFSANFYTHSINQSINQLIIFRGRVSNEESSFTVSLPGSRRQSRQPRLVFYFTRFKIIQTTQVSVLFTRFKTIQTTQVSVLFTGSR